jgi:hypothetical protein
MFPEKKKQSTSINSKVQKAKPDILSSSLLEIDYPVESPFVDS